MEIKCPLLLYICRYRVTLLVSLIYFLVPPTTLTNIVIFIVFTVDLSDLTVNSVEQKMLSSLSPVPSINCTTFVDMNDGSKWYDIMYKVNILMIARHLQ